MRSDATVDARGTLCPIPIVWAAEKMRSMLPGEVLEVLATDAAVLDDLPAWCRATGHEFIDFEVEGGVFAGYARHRA